MASIVFLTVHVLAHPHVAFAAPVKNHTALHTIYAPSWVADPTSRGTWSLLYSCLFTLGLCVWSAIHLNIPPRGEPQIKQFIRKTEWVVIAIFAPEIVLLSAWQQIYQARRFCAEMKRVRLEQERFPDYEETSCWRRGYDWLRRTKPAAYLQPQSQTTETASLTTSNFDDRLEKDRMAKSANFSLTYGFYVVMGGLTVDVSDIYDRVSTVTLGPAGVLDLAHKTSWKYFQVPDEQIRDKSKADNLAKALVVLQVTWMFFQCISRQVLGYPLTALEVHTLVHAGCALMMYAIWFRKPLNIRDSTLLDSTHFTEDLALLLVRSPGSAYKPFRNFVLPNRHGRYVSDYTASLSFLGKKHYPSPKTANEASFLLFDEAQLIISDSNADVRGCATEAEPLSIPLGQEESNTQSHGAGHDLVAEAANQDVADEDFGYDRDDAIHLLPLRSFTKLTEPAAISVVPFRDTQIVQTLMTGQTLRNGIGPNSFVTKQTEDWRYQISGKSRFLQSCLKALGLDFQESYSVIEIDERLKRRLPLAIQTPLSTDAIYHKVAISLSQKDFLRWQRTSVALRRELAGEDEEARDPDHNSRRILRSVDKETSHNLPAFLTSPIFHRSKNFDFTLSSAIFGIALGGVDPKTDVSTQLAMSYTMALLSGLYAGIHLALWNYDFPTLVESMLWKISACALGAPCALFIALVAVVFAILIVVVPLWLLLKNPAKKFARWIVAKRVYKGLRAFTQSSHSFRQAYKMTELLLIIIVAIPAICLALAIYAALGGGLIVYVFGRVYLVVESFISLRRVPIGVYESVSWAQYIPHL